MAAAMSNIEAVLGSVIKNLSEENYEQSFAQYRLLFDIAQTCSQIPSDFIFDTIWKQISNRVLPRDDSQHFIHPASPLVLRFARDAGSDSILAPHSPGLRNRLCTSILRQFFDHGLGVLYRGYSPDNDYLLDVNLIAHAVNLGYIEETVIREHILQFITGSPSTRTHYQELVLFVLFGIAGATFGACADPSVVDRCFEFLKGYDFSNWHVCWHQLKVGRLYEEVLTRAKTSGRRRSLNYGNVVGRVCLPHLYSQTVDQGKLVQARKIPSQPPSPYLWDYPA